MEGGHVVTPFRPRISTALEIPQVIHVIFRFRGEQKYFGEEETVKKLNPDVILVSMGFVFHPRGK